MSSYQEALEEVKEAIRNVQKNYNGNMYITLKKEHYTSLDRDYTFGIRLSDDLLTVEDIWVGDF